jgi:hypothetical protein
MTMQARRRALLVLAMAAAAMAAGESVRGQEAWHTLTDVERGFTVELPAAPKYQPTELRTGAGALYTMHRYVLAEGEHAYVVETTTYPSEVDVATPRANLQGGLDSAAKQMDAGKWASIDFLTHQGFPAVNAMGVRRDNAIRCFAVLKGRQFISLSYAGPLGSAQGPAVERFVGSLKFAKSP